MVICHRGRNFAPPDDLKPGDVLDGKDGLRWAYTRETSDDRGAAVFTLDKPRNQVQQASSLKVVPLRRRPTPALISESIVLARLEDPTGEPPEHLPDGYELPYSPTQWVKVTRDASGDKKHKPWHVDADGREVNQAGPDPWPLFNQADAIEHGRGRWIAEAEGEKCAMWLTAGGLVAVSQPGPDHTPMSIERRYQRLLEAGMAGVVYLADNDPPGEKKAQKCADAAAAVGLPFLVLHAAEVWPGLPKGGSIDDAPGTAAERAAVLLAAIPAALESQQQAAAAPPAEPQRRELTPQEKLSAMRGLAAELLEQQTPFPDRVPLLRARAELLGLTLRDQELQRFLWDARRAAAGAIEPLGAGDVIDLTPEPWHWEGVLMADCLNLITALPKAGKTSLLLEMIGAWSRGEPSFLGLPLIGPCPPVLIVGTDQPQSDWGRMLRQAGLLGDRNEILPPIVGLFHKGRPLHLDFEGIERIGGYASTYPGLLVLLDSISACTSALGLDENSTEIVEPINDLMEAVSPQHATVAAIHHSSKGRQGENATLASRGSTALPAAASQVISLARMASPATGAQDRRLVLKTEGRGGLPQQLLIERTEDGWISHGSAETVAMAQHLKEVEKKLSDRQADALDLVRERWDNGQQRTDASGLAGPMGLDGDAERKARSTLDQLARKGLLLSTVEAGLQGRRKVFWPVATESSRGVLSDVSEPSEPSEPSSARAHVDPRPKSEPFACRGSEGSEGREGQENTPRETLQISEPPEGSSTARIRSTTEWVETACDALKLAPHPVYLPEVMGWLRTREAGITQRQASDALERLRAADYDDDQPVFDLA